MELIACFFSHSPKSEDGSSYLSDNIDPPAALATVKEGQARMSVGKTLRLSISKFGAMNFTDDEDSAAPPSTTSAYEGSINTFPLSPDVTLDLQDVLSPLSAPIAAPLKSSTEENAMKKGVYVVVNTATQKETVSDNTTEDKKKESVPADNLTPNDPPKEDNSSPEANRPAGNGAMKGTPKVVLKGTPNNAPNTQKLTPGLSPMPSGNTVRRLSTLTPRGSPYTMTGKSSAAVASPAPAVTVSSDGGAPVTNASVEVSVEASAEGAEGAAGAVESAVEVARDKNVVADASTSEPDATFFGTSVKQLFASVGSAPSDVDADTADATNPETTTNDRTESAAADEPVEAEPAAAPSASPRIFRSASPASEDGNGFVSDTKKLKGGKHRNNTQKGRGLKM